MSNDKWKILLQTFFDILLEKCWKPKLDITEDKNELQQIINDWIENGCPKFTEDINELLKEKWLTLNKNLKIPKQVLEKEWGMLWLNYSPKYTIKQKICEHCNKVTVRQDNDYCDECLLELNEL